ncbi:uncharacterized protein Z518_09644 [Rhinocladiella mackenziei CBS 650.93]|uniref:Carboxylic ester hydrolase n=1 Tax=Rhinocladiella mackenziei CBS 650.93 TaxID=1442369 RepID=A0A0D2I487_9EURO|nr:uncharacterized protein Z518_09644 [Rhinocladiella mackenziei CBS 650.93]KIX00579.1 hypothetical protein Z518_09644 [Rhinocladiella mackenziei CBS 650.93]
MANIGKAITQSYYGYLPQRSYFYGDSTGGRQGVMLAQSCEMDAMTDAAIAACDDKDGVVYGIISLPYLCDFDPHTLVGKSFDCNGASAVFSNAAADIVEAALSGPGSSTGKFQWYGIGKDAELGSSGIGLASTICAEVGGCKAAPFPIADN